MTFKFDAGRSENFVVSSAMLFSKLFFAKLEGINPTPAICLRIFHAHDLFSMNFFSFLLTFVCWDADVKKLDRNACVAELTKLHVHLPVKLPNDNSEVSCTVTLN